MFVITVPSSKGDKTYKVRRVSETLWTCDCPDHIHRSKGEPYTCVHISSLSASLFTHVAASTLSEKAKETLGVKA